MCMVNVNVTSNISVNSTNVTLSLGENCGELGTKDGGLTVRECEYIYKTNRG